MNTSLAKKHDRSKMVMTVAFTVICIIYVLPILIVLMNSSQEQRRREHGDVRPPQRGYLRGSAELYQGHDLRQLSVLSRRCFTACS